MTTGQRWFVIVAVTIAAFVIIGALTGSTTRSNVTPVAQPSPAAQQAAQPETKVIQGYGTGTYEVGTGEGQVPPGRYQCSDGYFARLSGTSGSFSEIIANGIVNGPTVLTIKPTDKAIEFRGTWEWLGS